MIQVPTISVRYRFLTSSANPLSLWCKWLGRSTASDWRFSSSTSNWSIFNSSRIQSSSWFASRTRPSAISILWTVSHSGWLSAMGKPSRTLRSSALR